MRTHALFLVGALAALAVPSSAIAFDTGASGPIEYVDRDLTLGEGVLRIDFAPRDFGLMFGGIGGGTLTQDVPGFRTGRIDIGILDSTVLTLSAGATYGITSDLEAGAIIMPLYLAPDFDFGDIELFTRYRLLDGDIQIGLQGTVALPTASNFGLGVGAPVLFKLGKVRIDTGVELEIIFTDPTRVDLDVPVGVTFALQDGFFVGGRTGLFFADLEDIAIPLYGHAGYTIIAGEAPFIDLVASFGWPRFIWTGPGDAADIDTFDFILGGRFYFTVM